MDGKGKTTVTKEEILELMELRDWSEAMLAAQLQLSQWAVRRWINGERGPSGPARVLLHQWLAAARAESKNGKGRRREMAGAK